MWQDAQLGFTVGQEKMEDQVAVLCPETSRSSTATVIENGTLLNVNNTPLCYHTFAN